MTVDIKLSMRPKIKISYSSSKDIQNYLNAGWKFTYATHGRDPKQFLARLPNDFQKKLTNAPTKPQATKVIKSYWEKSRTINFNQNTKLTIKWMQIIINNEWKNIVNLLELVYQQKFPFEQIHIYLTTFPINPYNYKEKWFMVGRNSSIVGIISTTKHELNHFMFYFYFLEELRKRNVSLEKREKLKEALAILTNPEGNDKPDVKELEKYIQSQKEKPVKEIIDRCMESGLL